MFGTIGGAEIFLILVVALILFGPRKLPQIGKTIGRGLAEFRKATTDFKSSLEREVNLEEVKATGRDLSAAVNEMNNVARGAAEPVSHARPTPVASDVAPGPAANDVTPAPAPVAKDATPAPPEPESPSPSGDDSKTDQS